MEGQIEANVSHLWGTHLLLFQSYWSIWKNRLHYTIYFPIS